MWATSRNRGVPVIIPFSVDSTSLEIKTIDLEVNGDYQLGVYFDNPNRALVDSLQFHYSIDDGQNWTNAAITQSINPISTDPDTLWIMWSTNDDLPNLDIPNVKLRISANLVSLVVAACK